jgi:hypothetical protein
MRDGRLVLQAHGPDGSTIYALAEGGARQLQDAGVAACSGKDAARNLSGGYFFHRCIANQLAIAGIVQGYRVATEHEVARGLWTGGEAGLAGKRPDVIWRDGGQWLWFEVERSRRNSTDYARLLAWLDEVHRLMQGGRLAQTIAGIVSLRVVFICSPQFSAKVTGDLLARRWTGNDIEKLLVFETSLYDLKERVFY